MHYLLITISAALLVAAPADGAKKSDPVRVLIVTGDDHPAHKWKETAPVIRDILQEDKRFKVDISDDIYENDVLASDKLFDYDLLFLHFKNFKPLANEEEARANLKKFIEGGKGLVVFHFACGAFEEWPEFAQIAGRVWDRKTAHDPRGPFTVKIVNTEHPITAGMKGFEADDELYICLVGDRPITLLATARSKVTGKDHPMAFAFNYGKGRVFQTPLGHDVKAIRMPGVPELIRRGTAWAAGLEPK
jgi:type 1 glutamine amidotransferase